MDGLIGVLLTLAFVGLVVWILVTYIVTIEPFRTIIIAVAAIFALLYVMSALGIVDMPLPRVR